MTTRNSTQVPARTRLQTGSAAPPPAAGGGCRRPVLDFAGEELEKIKKFKELPTRVQEDARGWADAVQLLGKWLSGTGSAWLEYGPGSLQVRQIRQSRGVRQGIADAK